MLIKHIFSYFISKGLTGILTFVGIALYTRMLTTADYGEYALIVATATLINAILFQWIRLVLLRFLSKYKKEKSEHLLLSTLCVSYIVILVFLIFVTVLISFFKLISFHFIISILLFTISQSLFEIVLEILRSSLYANIYGILSVFKSIISLGASLLLIKVGLGSVALIIGSVLGALISLTFIFILAFKKQKVSISLLVSNGLRNFDYKLLKEFLTYGIPLTATLSMSFIIDQSDRLLLGWFAGKSEVGVYSVAYDLTQQTIITVMMVINLAAYPLCVRALETKGVEAARKQVKSNVTALLLVSIPSMVGMVALSDSVSSTVLGRDFSEKSSGIVSVIAIVAFLQGVKVYYLDHSFQLGKKTNLQFYPVLVSGVLNVILNLILIPLYKIQGAVYATLISYIVAIFLSWRIGKGIFPLPFPFKDFAKIAICSLLMGVPLYFLNSAQETLYGLLFKILLGAFIYFIAIYSLNVWDIKYRLGIFVNKTSKNKQGLRLP
ncbi:oligosaccharide flippase family protein [Geobacillus thermodenitrificans]|uniref:oligosaccharide flippase family protein n=1 Tax=Geobacillus thermodenitrificans TaxID=33940 RepID=UPI00040B8786|nr:oligosaccharide flippase family protein [Geobacillus thermodenitrificans]ARA98318.1 hypothetical protein GD3902_09920 [Geobacillus thermodenitrificans]